jgi:ABC-type Mn2+/Zn2+ transport system permease subunit
VEFLTDPVGWWVEPITTNPFMQRALLASLLAVLGTSVVGTWVVLRGMAFFGHALAHGVLPGIAIAFIVGHSTTIGALAAAALMVAGINAVKVHSPLPEDAGIGLLFVGMLAVTVVLLSSHQVGYAGDLSRFLFGSVTGVTTDDLRSQAVAVAVTLAGLVLLHRAFLVLTFDETQARLLGLRPRLAHLSLLGLVAMATVSAFEAVGSLLVFAFLIAPPAAASLVVRRVPLIMVGSVAFGAGSVVVGMLISFHYGTASGATMALTSVVVFFVVLAVTSRLRAARNRQLAATPG